MLKMPSSFLRLEHIKQQIKKTPEKFQDPKPEIPEIPEIKIKVSNGTIGTPITDSLKPSLSATIKQVADELVSLSIGISSGTPQYQAIEKAFNALEAVGDLSDQENSVEKVNAAVAMARDTVAKLSAPAKLQFDPSLIIKDKLNFSSNGIPVGPTFAEKQQEFSSLVGQLSWVMDLFSEDHLKDYEILQAVGKVATSAEQLTEINYG
ncbi:MAG: hypothetical protein HQM08_30355, partial [Candidatus Riflebacteria bacterium]|nr:hypothetical protein [Candidatus Riflebacteria bacterium]